MVDETITNKKAQNGSKKKSSDKQGLKSPVVNEETSQQQGSSSSNSSNKKSAKSKKHSQPKQANQTNSPKPSSTAEGSSNSCSSSSKGSSSIQGRKRRPRKNRQKGKSPVAEAESNSERNESPKATDKSSPSHKDTCSDPELSPGSHYPHIYADFARRQAVSSGPRRPKPEKHRQSPEAPHRPREFHPRPHFGTNLILAYCCEQLYYVSTPEFLEHRCKKGTHQAWFDNSKHPVVCCDTRFRSIGSLRHHMRYFHSSHMHHWQQEVQIFRTVTANLQQGNPEKMYSDALPYDIHCCKTVFKKVLDLETHLDNVHNPPDWYVVPGKKEVLEQTRVMFENYLGGVRSMLPQSMWYENIAYQSAMNAAWNAQNNVIQQWNVQATVDQRRAFNDQLAAWHADEQEQHWYWTQSRLRADASSEETPSLASDGTSKQSNSGQTNVSIDPFTHQLPGYLASRASSSHSNRTSFKHGSLSQHNLLSNEASRVTPEYIGPKPPPVSPGYNRTISGPIIAGSPSSLSASAEEFVPRMLR